MEAYVKELDERKVNMVVINKADLLSRRQRYTSSFFPLYPSTSPNNCVLDELGPTISKHKG